jgi:hypothetical protein
MLSFVHEVGTEKENSPTPYEHTHVFVWCKKNIETTNQRYFDIDEIHPNIQNKRGIEWARTIVMNYHLGNKTAADGKKYFAEPVFLHQEGVEQWKIEEDRFKLAVDAPTLVDACLELDIQPKSISDVVTLRNHAAKRQFARIDTGVDPANFKSIEWDRGKALILKGPSETGKTNWAIHQFEHPIKVEDIDNLKNLPSDCDGLVFDEYIFDKCCQKTQVSVLDIKQDRTIRARNTNALIPRGLPRIFCCNEYQNVFGEHPPPAVTSRYNEWLVTPGMLVANIVPR